MHLPGRRETRPDGPSYGETHVGLTVTSLAVPFPQRADHASRRGIIPAIPGEKRQEQGLSFRKRPPCITPSPKLDLLFASSKVRHSGLATRTVSHATTSETIAVGFSESSPPTSVVVLAPIVANEVATKERPRAGPPVRVTWPASGLVVAIPIALRNSGHAADVGGTVYDWFPENLSHGGRHLLSATDGLAGNGPVNAQWTSHRESIAIRGAPSGADG